jgi:hypothetical protein
VCADLLLGRKKVANALAKRMELVKVGGFVLFEA